MYKYSENYAKRDNLRVFHSHGIVPCQVRLVARSPHTRDYPLLPHVYWFRDITKNGNCFNIFYLTASTFDGLFDIDDNERIWLFTVTSLKGCVY